MAKASVPGGKRRIEGRPSTARVVALVAASALAVALGACDGAKWNFLEGNAARSATAAKDRLRLPPSDLGDGAEAHLALGIKNLEGGNLEAASAEFNRGLKYDPRHPLLNFLNGYAYHQEARGGKTTQGELAEVGYRLALQFDPRMRPAAVQLGYLAIERRNWRQAQNEFARALLIEPDDPGVLYALAYASYLAGDAATARDALARLPAKALAHPEVIRARAVVAAAVGERDEAAAHLAAYAATEPDAKQRDRLARRVGQWTDLQRSLERKQAQLMQVDPERAPAPSPPASQRPAGSSFTGTTATPKSSDKKDSAASNRSDLKMVILDCIIIRREEVTSSSRGVNLLDGLQLQFGGTLVNFSDTSTKDLITQADSTATRTFTKSINLTFPTVTYSLNIANAQDSSSRILGRPSIIAQDGEQSEFFLGSEITYITSAGTGTFGSSTSKEVGLQLKVRPEFLEDDRIKLDVEAEFLAFEPVASSGTFQQAVQTAKNRARITATMEFGRTLIIGGGSESLETDLSKGVPVLRDIPFVQTLFSTRSKSRTERSVLMLVTPRRPTSLTDETAMDAAIKELSGAENLDPEQVRQLKERYRVWFNPTSNIVLALARMSETPLYHEFRQGDFRLFDVDGDGDLDLVHSESRADRILREALEWLDFAR
jgi:general secretion pathway protein D